MSTECPVVPLDLGLTYGALLVGSLIGCVLWGVQALQTVWYYLHYPTDPTSLKLFVAFINAVGTADNVMGILSIWHGAIRNSGLPPDIFSNPLLFIRIPFSGVVALLSQFFFVYRIFRFADLPLIKYGVPILLSPLIIFQLVGNSLSAGTWLATNPGSNPLAAEIRAQEHLQRIIIALYSATCAADIVIAFVMCFLLFRRRTGLKRTDRLLSNLAIASINTGSWTAIDSILIVILTSSTPTSTFLFAAPNFLFSSLYINTVLCNLNIRQFFRERESQPSSLGLSSHIRFGRARPRDGSNATPGVAVKGKKFVDSTTTEGTSSSTMPSFGDSETARNTEANTFELASPSSSYKIGSRGFSEGSTTRIEEEP